ncbi:metallophosphoesterase family protein [Pseudomonadota bacterium]
MTIAKLLVVDDEHKERRAKYELIVEGQSLSAEGIHLQLDYLEKFDELPNKLATGLYDGLIVDVRLEPQWGISLDKLLKHVDQDMPLALISSKWDDTNSDAVNEAWSRPSCRTFLHFSDLISNEQGALQRTRLALKKMVSEHRKMDMSLKVEDAEPITIAHFSDLHFGGVDPGQVEQETNRIIERINQQTSGRGVSFIAVTGDITQRGRPSEFKQAEKWLRGVADKLQVPVPSPRILIVPGNHDICLPLAAGAAVEFNDGKLNLRQEALEGQETLTTYALRPYIDFHDRVSTVSRILPLASSPGQSLPWLERRFAHLGIIFYGLNTAQPIECAGLPEREANKDGLNAIDNALAEMPKNTENPLVVGLTHHSPLGQHEDRSVTNPETFARFFPAEYPTALLMHGHTHERSIYDISKPTRLVVSTAPTMSKDENGRPKDTLRGFTLLELSRNNGQVISLKASMFGWESTGLKGPDVLLFDRHPVDRLFRAKT